MKLKKLLCILLGLIMLVGMVAPCASALKTTAPTPVIYMRGKGTDLYSNIGTDEQTQIFPLSYDDNYIKDNVLKILPTLALAMVTNNYDDYCDKLYNCVAPIYEDVIMDKNGDARDNSGIVWDWPSTPLKDTKSNGEYDIYDYVFRYDWRIDPCEAADSLNDYINAVKEVTGANKVSLISRCYATNVVMAYLAEYGHDDVDCCEFYCSTINGITSCGEPFSGKLSLDNDAIDRYAQQALSDDVLMQFLKATVTLMNKTQTLNGVTLTVNQIYSKVASNVVPRLLLATYANMPAYWSMVDDKDYEDAKALVFADSKEEYAGLIDKIDNYHYNVQLKAPEILQQYVDEGMRIAIICKYGFQTPPITDTIDEIGDDTISLNYESFGATCAKIESTLDKDYISAQEAAGKGNYISPDNQVDASTALFPDNTWFIKNIEHLDFPGCVNSLLMDIVKYDGQMTVTDTEKYPQFLVYDKETESLSPMTGDNHNTEPSWNVSFFQSIINFFKTFFAYIKSLFSSIGTN